MTAWPRWLAFVLWAAAVLALAPMANGVQKWIGDRLGAGALRSALMGLVVTLTLALVIWLLRRPVAAYRQVFWLLGLAAAGLIVMWRLRVAAEPAHIVGFAVLAVLAFRALSVRLRDDGVYLAAAALTAIVGTVDEIVQWLLPRRYWGFGDVSLDVLAGVLALLSIRQGWRPPGIAAGFSPGSLRVAVRLAAVVVVLLTLCLANTPQRIEWYGARIPGLGHLGKELGTRMTEYGHRYVDPEIGLFFSRLSPAELRRTDRERGAEAAKILERFRQPKSYHKFQVNYRPSVDPFVFEAGGHLFYRERLSQRIRELSDPDEKRRLGTVAWRENLILERYFPQTLASSNLGLDAAGRQWLQALHEPGAEFASEVSNWLTTGFNEAQARWMLLAVLAGLLWADRKLAREAGPQSAGTADSGH